MKLQIESGQIHGCLTFLQRTGSASNGSARWRVRCSCGSEKELAASLVLSCDPPSCRCPLKIGARVGKLTVVEVRTGDRAANGGHVSRVRCDCGAVKTVAQADLKRGGTRSCGCDRGRLLVEAAIEAGRTAYSPAAKFWAGRWRNMLERCFDPTSDRYDSYGGRGIGVCDDFQELETFAAHMQVLLDDWPKNAPFHLDRIDVEGDYCPGNMRLVTPLDSARNKTTTVYVVYQGREIPVTEAAELSGIEQSTLRWRVREGWAEEDIFKCPLPNKGRPKRKEII